MREEEFDKIVKQQINEQIKAPEELKARIRKEISEIDTKKKNKNKIKFIQGFAAMFTIAILGVTTYAGITGNLNLQKLGLLKASQNYMENSLDINKKISNEYVDITLKTVACDNSYFIMEYQIDTKDKFKEKYGEIKSSENGEYKLDMLDNVEINSQKTVNVLENITKVAENSYSYFKVYNVMDIKDKQMNIDIKLNHIMVNNGELLNEGYEDERIIVNKNIKLEVTRENTEVQTFKRLEETVSNKVISIEDVVNSNFETFILAKQTIKDITMKEYAENPTEFNDFIVKQLNGDDMPYAVHTDKIYIIRNNGKKILYSSLLEGDIKDEEKVTIEENYQIILGKPEDEVKNIKVTARIGSLLNDRTGEEENYYNNAKWYKLEDKKYTEYNNIGAMLEIKNVEIAQDKITFYYDKKGDLQNANLVVMRANNGKYNYICPSIEEEKGLNSNENKIVFLRKDRFPVGVFDNDIDDEQSRHLLDDISKLEFSMMFGKSQAKEIGKGFELEIPKQNVQKIEVKNIEIKDLEGKDKSNENEINDIVPDVDESQNANKTDVNELEQNEIKNEKVVFENKHIQSIQDMISNATKAKKSEMSIGGIKVGMTKEEVEKIIGKPTIEDDFATDGQKVEAIYGTQGGGEDTSIVYEKQNGQYKLRYMAMVEPYDMKTDRGISIGDSLQKVITQYAKDKTLKKIEGMQGEELLYYNLYGNEEFKVSEDNMIVRKSDNSEYAYIMVENMKGKESDFIEITYVSGNCEIRYCLNNDKIINIMIFDQDYYAY